MYAPYYFPQHQEIRFKDFLEDMKAYDEWKSSQKPKEDKKTDPGKWSTTDYITFVFFVNALVVPIGTCALLAYATAFMKAIPH
jgi:hypothetical protein